jgi:hypothetical protein
MRFWAFLLCVILHCPMFLKNGITEMICHLIFALGVSDLAGRFKKDHRHADSCVGIDLGETTFHLLALGDSGKVFMKKKHTQQQLITFTPKTFHHQACSGKQHNR